jgi:hypothetical protein
VRVFAAAVLCAALLASGCGPGLSKVNGRPDSYYGKTLGFSGRMGDVLVQNAKGDPQVFQLVDRHGHRIIVASARPVRFRFGDRITARGEFVKEATVDGRDFYDAIASAQVIGIRRLSWLPFR